MQRTVGRLGKQEFHAEDTISQLPLGAVQLLICKSVTRKGENWLEKNIFKVKKNCLEKSCMSVCAPSAFYANFPCASRLYSLLQKVFINMLI